MIEAELTVNSEQGLHARPADLFMRAANKYKSDIQICNLTNSSGFVSAKSILRILALGVYHGYRIRLRINGTDEKEAAAELSALVNSNFKE